jgi:hypothetical protein
MPRRASTPYDEAGRSRVVEKRIAAAIAGVVWLSALASAAGLSFGLNRPVAVEESTTGVATRTAGSYLVPAAADEKVGTSVLEVPTVTIVGEVPPSTGAAEMQRPDDVIIGPGIVTYP